MVCNEWCGEHGANSGDEDEAPKESDEFVVSGAQSGDTLSIKSDGTNGNERQLETNVVQIKRIDAQHDQEGECTGTQGDGFSV